MFGTDRKQLRAVFFEAWRRHLDKLPLEPVQGMVVDVIQLHPEYQAMLADPDRYQDRDYLPDSGETNPFLHMAMHLAIGEQLGTDRPAGIGTAYRSLCNQVGDVHEAQHHMMECLGASLWEAQRNGTAPDEQGYLACLRKLLGNNSRDA